ncbi:MAG TPA: extracellular solute-binding protein [Nocardioides sp.]|jgi:cellobiose transport system substrate-binding protein|uniref:extracellular solute-binding protein n=1 Tax=Nocardioides sp. TaxID=35761 RepID=UPI002E35CEA6|nr:extracellular solute-binding protein [Nocardioides sp.]HEX3931381.1 extracellular solute-binding protein [Nocardioides sp.]
MSRSSTRRKGAALLAVSALAAFVLAGCGGSGSSGSAGDQAAAGPCGTTADTTVTVGLFGTFGFKEAGLWDAYHKLCPNITVKEDDVEQSADYWTRLKTRLASGSGLDDVQGIEIGFVADVVQNHASQFVNWNTVPNATADKAEFFPWKWQLASTSDGQTTVGLGTDIGPEAICYRQDLLKQAGLPSDPATLAQKWKTWDDFIAFGKQYEASTSKPSGSHFVDSAASIFSTAVYQGTEAYDNADGQPDVANSDGVKNAWTYASQAAQDGITAGLQQFTPEWNKAFSSGAFATLACPTWMMGYIQGQAGDSYAGKWDIAPVLPGGATNWGGSWLGVPDKAAHKDAAIALVEWLSAKAQQVTMWKQGGHFPSNSDAAADPGVAKATSAYFSNAPVGQIFGDIAQQMKIPPIGLYDTQIQQALTTQLTNVETKGTSPDDAFNDALDAIKQVTG